MEPMMNVLVQKVENKICKNGNPYCLLIVTDGVETHQMYDWNAKTNDEIAKVKSYEGEVVNVTLDTSNEKYMTILKIEIDKEHKAKDYIKKAPIDSETMYNEIMSKLKALDTPLKYLAGCLYRDNKEKLFRWGGAKTIHHAEYGGLLYHHYRMLLMAEKVADVYPIDRDLLMVGVVIHDIGKLDELTTSETGMTDYTVDGVLGSHTLSGILMVRKEKEKIDVSIDKAEAEGKKSGFERISDEDMRLLEHMIASHMGKPEYGAITTPSTLEALLLHQLDMIDSQSYVFEETLSGLQEGEISDLVHASGDYRIYKSVKKENKEDNTNG